MVWRNARLLVLQLPLFFCRPPRRRHLSLGDILRVTRFERLVPRRTFGRSFNALLAEADSLYLVAFLSHDDMAFGFMVRRSFGLVIPRHAGTSEARVFLHFFLAFFLAIVMGLPIFFAAFLAAAMPAFV